MAQTMAPVAISPACEITVWESQNEGIEHALDPNDPNQKIEGGFSFGGIRFLDFTWLDGSRGAYAPTKEVK